MSPSMRAIIIGAGRGSRLRHLTDEVPKTLVPVLGRPMLESILDALAAGGFRREDVTFICGYRKEVVQERYPELEFVENVAWESNNILASLLCARDRMRGGFVSTYADIVYRPAVVEALVKAEGDLVLAVDTDWRRRYAGRTQHPENDAEKLVHRVPAGGAAGADPGTGKVERISRTIPADEATGEFIGVMKASPRGAETLLAAFDEVRARLGDDGVFREGRILRKAYLLDMLAHLAEQGVEMRTVDTHGGYMEIDTLQDQQLAATWWAGGLAG
jgi:choline kinase